MTYETEVVQLSIAELRNKIKSRELSPVEVARIFLDRIERIDRKINSYITVVKDRALSDAQEVERSGRSSNPLAGVPFGIKDLIATEGIRTTSGSKFLSEYIPRHDATVVSKIKAAGAVVLGKNNLGEFAYHTTSQNPHYGGVRNPWNLQHEPGGSSGGSSAAVAASLCIASLGTDTGGSVRIPSSLCGNVGLKPTYGRISVFGVTPLSWSLDHVGIIGNCVSDIATILETIAGRDENDPASETEPVPKFSAELESSIRGLRVGVPDDYFFEEGVEKEVRNAVLKSVDLLKDLGAIIQSISLPSMRFSRYVTLVIMSSEASCYHEKYMRDHKEEYGRETRARLEFGNALPATWYLKAQRLRREMFEEFQRKCKTINAIVTPTTPITAPRIDQSTVEYGGISISPARLLPRFTSAFNLMGLPALSLPCGFTSAGLPIGMQIVGKTFQEGLLLRLAREFEENSSWHKRKPQI
jgi:aspartyl-tRNA(Asn)/glutamyl-tRNA(Gln) amidotransferase subunit A